MACLCLCSKIPQGVGGRGVGRGRGLGGGRQGFRLHVGVRWQACAHTRGWAPGRLLHREEDRAGRQWPASSPAVDGQCGPPRPRALSLSRRGCPGPLSRGPPLPGRVGPPWPVGCSAGVQGPQREAQTAQDRLGSAWRPPCSHHLSEEPLQETAWWCGLSPAPAPLTHSTITRNGHKPPPVCLPRSHDSGCWGRGPMGVDTQYGGAASYFPGEPGLDQSGHQALVVPWVQHPSPPGASCLSLKETDRGLGKGVPPAGWPCMGQGPRGATVMGWGRAPGGQ